MDMPVFPHIIFSQMHAIIFVIINIIFVNISDCRISIEAMFYWIYFMVNTFLLIFILKHLCSKLHVYQNNKALVAHPPV